MGHYLRFEFRVIVALSNVPLHARNLEVAQTALGPACANLDFSDYRDRPLIDDREFFVSASCWHPSFIHPQQIVYIPEPRVPGVVFDDHLPGLTYLVRARLVAYQDWRAPPAAPGNDGANDGDGGGHGPGQHQGPGGGGPGLDDDALEEGGDGEVDDDPPPAGSQSVSTAHGTLATQDTVRIGQVSCPLRGESDRWPLLSAPRTPAPRCTKPRSLLDGEDLQPKFSGLYREAIAASPSPMLRRVPVSSPVGFIGRFLAIAPNLLQDGRSSQSAVVVFDDWWASCVQGELSAAHSQPAAREHANEEDAAQEDWWSTVVDAEFARPQQLGAVDVSAVALVAELGQQEPAELGFGDAGTSAAPPATPRTILTNLEGRLCIPMETPLLKEKPRLRRAKTPATVQSIRRSARIAATPREPNVNAQARVVLLKKLGFHTDSPAGGHDTAQLCRRAFQQPLSDASHANLQKLLGAEFDPVAFNLNMLGLDEESAGQ